VTGLPIDGLLPEIVAALGAQRSLVLEAPPGAGKTTRVPPALLKAFPGEILVLEPRRLAARMAARRVAAELGEKLGETVGYQVRFEGVTSPRTRLRFLTEGVLNRRFLTDPELSRASVVILDEFHERHLDGDLALALVRRLQLGARPDLRIVVMSATLTSEPISAYLDSCPVLRSQGRLFETAVGYRPHSPAPLEQQVASAVEDLVNKGLDGDVLVFLPGAAEIRRAARACDGIARRAGLLVAPLHGDLSPEEQDLAVSPADRPKIILSTNVAESSITIEGVTAVIDSGLARVARDSHWTGLPTLEVQRISRASATQRAGRAGRVRPGRVVRLYTAEDFARRPAGDVPEIRRRELSQVLLELEALGIEDVPWFEAPPGESFENARALLDRLGAAEHGREMARYPLHPRLSRLLIEASKRGAVEDACTAAALLSSGDRYEDANLLHALDRPLPPRTAQVRRQIRHLARGTRREPAGDEALLLSVLAGFPDRVARRRNEREIQLSSGLAAEFTGTLPGQFLVALDLEDRSDRALPVVRLAAPIEPEWLIELFPERVRETDELTWNRTAERVESVSSLRYDDLVIEESRSGKVDPVRAGEMLAAKALEAGLHRFVDPDELEAFLARAAFAAEHSPIKPVGDQEVREALAGLASGLRSFEEMRGLSLVKALRARLGAGQSSLDEVAPEHLKIGKRQVKVHYPRGQQPWIASRLQDFFGLRKTPRVARGKVPVVVHLLAPNQRPVQMTSDLAGFWERLYPQVRKELMRRYPKHAWPEYK
jgi:ATP-dependent helicase HrpB